MTGKETIDVGKRTLVRVQGTGGDLVIKGWRRAEIQLEGADSPTTVTEKSDHILIEGAGDLVLSVPHQLRVEVGSIGGDASISNLGAALSVNQLGGDLSLRNVSGTTVKSIGGDLFAKHTRGDITLENLGGDCLVSDLDGQIAGKGIGGDLMAKEIGGGMDISVGGDINAHFSPVPWQAYALSAKGDIFAHIPEDSNAEFKISSDKGTIILQDEDESRRLDENEHTYIMGEGGAQVKLSAKGEVMLSTESGTWSPEFSVDPDVMGLAGQITQQTTEQIQRQLSSLEKHLDKHLSGVSKSLESLELPEEKVKIIQRKIEEASQRAAMKAQKATQKAEVKLERKIAKAQKKARAKKPTFDLHDFLSKKEQEHRQATEEERMMILKMLEEKKITAKQAEKLLSALEGGEG